MVIAAVLSLVGIRRTPRPHDRERIEVENCTHCAIAGPPAHPADHIH